MTGGLTFFFIVFTLSSYGTISNAYPDEYAESDFDRLPHHYRHHPRRAPQPHQLQQLLQERNIELQQQLLDQTEEETLGPKL